MRVQFAAFTLDLDTRQLLHERKEIHLAPKAFELLSALVTARPRALTKAELQQRLWPDTFVAEANLSNLISEIRAVMDDSARRPRYIRTAHGFGYSFCADATMLTERGEAPHRPAYWLEWGQRRFPLFPGEHVIGRDPAAAVTLDGATVSRRHARLIVGRDGVVLEDELSKNGTYRGDERVTAPITLADGDVIRIDSVLVTFHAGRGLDSTDTRVTAS